MSTFISYSRVNSDFAIRLARDLKAAGFDIWFDQLDIPTGARWDDEIEKALERSSSFLIILSPDSIESQNVKDEVGYAIDSGKYIVPVITEPCKIPFRLRRFQYVDFTSKPYEENFAQIQQILREPAPASRDPSVVPPKSLKEFKKAQTRRSQSENRSRLTILLLGAGMCAFVTAGVAVTIWILSRSGPAVPPSDRNQTPIVTGSTDSLPPGKTRAVSTTVPPTRRFTATPTKDIPTKAKPTPAVPDVITPPQPARPRSDIDQKYESLGSERGFLGPPVSDETTTPDGIGRFRHFQGGSIYWTPDTGAWEVHGYIRDKWESLGWERGILGYPITDETTTPDGIGRFNHFQGGSIYWTPDTGAWEVHGYIRDKWESLGWERGILGYPLTDETTTPDGIGRFNHFQGGSIYWTPDTGAWEVHGLIRDKWESLGWERGILGYPITDETTTPDGIGRFNHFQGGSIYWTPNTGAWEVHGDILARWGALGWERSCLGYPVSDEEPAGGEWTRQSRFERGIIQWSPSRGAVETCY